MVSKADLCRRAASTAAVTLADVDLPGEGVRGVVNTLTCQFLVGFLERVPSVPTKRFVGITLSG
eukprot:78515-Prorocentrum_lima.AAC.1